MALYNTIKRLIDLDRTAGLSEKIDIFFAVGSLSREQYEELTQLLG